MLAHIEIQGFGLITRAETTEFKDFVINPVDSYSSVVGTLTSSAKRRQIEMATVLNSSCQIIANSYTPRVGEYFSPEGICEDIRNDPRRMCMITTHSADYFALNKATQYL